MVIKSFLCENPPTSWKRISILVLNLRFQKTFQAVFFAAIFTRLFGRWRGAVTAVIGSGCAHLNPPVYLLTSTPDRPFECICKRFCRAAGYTVVGFDPEPRPLADRPQRLDRDHNEWGADVGRGGALVRIIQTTNVVKSKTLLQ